VLIASAVAILGYWRASTIYGAGEGNEEHFHYFSKTL
jgi:hypothetical protein